MSSRARLFFASLVIATFVACTLGAGSFAGKTCDTQADCPDPYVCAQVRPGGSTCELLHGLDSFETDGGGVGGGAGGGGGTVVPDWCSAISPIVMTNCVSNCHGTDHSYTGSPTNFRLDLYTVDGGQGAYDYAASMAVQVQVDLMPPIGIDPMPNAAERQKIIDWANGGAPYCLDAGP
ncbi:MAG: hypothetical protein QM723_37815 [Myxococcaceae bacterium]